ncbi:MAG: hypothetical protein V3S14_08615, partial [Anaerolineae bacterium]
LFDLPQYTFPITLVCFGYPKTTLSAKERTPRFPQEYIRFENTYKRFDKTALDKMLESREPQRYFGNAVNTWIAHDK